MHIYIGFCVCSIRWGLFRNIWYPREVSVPSFNVRSMKSGGQYNITDMCAISGPVCSNYVDESETHVNAELERCVFFLL